MSDHVFFNGRDDAGVEKKVRINVTGGSAHTRDVAPIPSSYTGDITFNTGGVAVALATDVKQVTVTNTDTTNFGRFAYGESSAEAITNAATGKRIFPATAANTSTSTLTRGRPDNATHFAIVANTASILVDVQQEV